jgi:hypothetical protein
MKDKRGGCGSVCGRIMSSVYFLVAEVWTAIHERKKMLIFHFQDWKRMYGLFD